MSRPIDVDAVRADDHLVENLRAGHVPDDALARELADWQAETNGRQQ